jgi:PIN domain nuclease of toxin-antitoxin system
MQIKIYIGKLKLPMPLKDTVQAQRTNNHIRLLPIKLSHIYQTALLPDHHKDPFDRLIVAQAVIERLPIITTDSQVAQYPVTVVW